MESLFLTTYVVDRTLHFRKTQTVVHIDINTIDLQQNIPEVLYSQRQKPMLHYNGFCYHFHSFSTDRTRRYWRCADRRICNARCTTDQDLDKIHIIRDGTGDHQHNVGVEGQVRKTVNALKRRAQEEPNATPSQVLRTTIGGVHSEEVLLMLPERNALKRNVNRVQNSTRPPNPTSMRGVELPMNYRVIKRGEPFLMHDSGAEDEERVLIFSTQENVRHLSASATLSCDGTFKTSPTQLAQLFTVHGVVLGYPVPLVYALTMRKREQTYRYVYQRIIDYGEERNWNINPSLCMMDFELANMNAIRSLLPNAEIKGCLFHISQSLWRRISSSGLASSYNAVESDTRRCASMLFGLPFVPVEDVVETFEYIEDQAEESLDDLMDYVKRTYVTGRPPMFPPQTWNVYRAVLNDQHRTNNAVECWHNKFQKVMVVHYPSIWKFIEVLKDEQEDNEQAIAQMLGDHRQIRPATSRRYRQNQAQITGVVKNYGTYKANDQMDIYLKAIAYRLKCNPAEADDQD
ncbi:hypothetical protein M514_08442 [Trichuris suis]|uniref:FLYWCH-type domain-containing protein n=1 Tax=Trichuris suis TaxID=68888 RepID=A0A085MV02_9BILA|nr:hypothetical protein M514_08442 [Trichuris suis]